jgi:hypothetical protein
VGLIPQRRGTRSCPRVGTKKYSLCATHKSFGNAYRRGVKQDASSVHAGEPHQPVDTAAGCPLSKDGRGERAPRDHRRKLNRSVHAIKLRAYTIGLPLKWFRGKEPPTTLPKPLKAAISRASRTARTAQGRRNRQIIARNGLRTNGGHEGCTAASKLIQFVSDAHSLGAYTTNYVCAGRTPEAREAVKQPLKLHPGFRASHANKAFPVSLSDLRNQITAAFREAGCRTSPSSAKARVGPRSVAAAAAFVRPRWAGDFVQPQLAEVVSVQPQLAAVVSVQPPLVQALASALQPLAGQA